jgi:site-specific recombinase XerD
MTNFHLVYHLSASPASSPYRLLDLRGKQPRALNSFLDAQQIRGLSPRSLRSYGYDLLNFARWWWRRKRFSLARLNQSRLLDYVRYQLLSAPKPTPQTVNHRLTVVRCLYRFLYNREIPPSRGSTLSTQKTRSPLGYGRPGRRTVGLRLKQPRRVIVPLSRHEVSRFWSSFRTYRDLSVVALMLFNGLRSCEILELQLEHIHLSEAQIRVRGKGNKERVLPLERNIIQTIRRYLCYERPAVSSSYLFLSLKGNRRGLAMTPAGLRSLFRHHRRSANVLQANPHRFRHTFGHDMARAGISLPALMHLMGHAHIQTTLLYVRLCPQDVWREFRRATRNLPRLSDPEKL